MAAVDPKRFVEAYLEEAHEHLELIEAGLLRLESNPRQGEHVDEVFRAAHSIKGGAAAFGFPEIVRFAHSVEGVLDRVRQGDCGVTPSLIALLLSAADALRDLLATTGRGEPPQPSVVALIAALDRERDGGGPSEPAPAPQPAAEAATIRVAIDKIDTLMDLAGELVIAQSMVMQNVNRLGFGDGVLDLREAVGELERRTRDLQERVMAIRMVPVGMLFSRFPRVVRDLAGSLGKQATLELVGTDTELDRGLIEHVTDPLLHLIRNALDHGIEPPDERLAAGKPPQGRLTLTASHQGGSIVIEVTDDGRGLDRARLRDKAVAQGILVGDPLDDDELIELLCRPGFSTATAVTGISGRGVGMDVVLRNVQALNGSLRVRSAPGGGTTFRLALPLTLSILDGLCLSVGEQSYVLPMSAIVGSLQLPPGALRPLAGRGETVLVRGEVLPLIRLYRLFGVSTEVTDPQRGLLVIVEQEGRRAALMVDNVKGQVQAVVKSLESNYRRLEGLMGATILGDARVALILDVVGLLRLAHAPLRGQA